MAIRLENEFVVNAPIEATWPVLLDLSRVSRCLPGATLEPEGDGDGYRGTMKVKLGPVVTEYKGTARLEDADASARRATVRVEGKETRGQGTASALIQNRLEPADGATRVIVETDVNVTGRPAQFGRGIMQGVAGKLLAEFAVRLEREIGAGVEVDEEPAPAARGAAERSGAEVLDLGSAAGRALGLRAAALLAGAAALVALVVRLVRRR
jgi:carbon monoxide dehydrogenase subunit G